MSANSARSSWRPASLNLCLPCSHLELLKRSTALIGHSPDLWSAELQQQSEEEVSLCEQCP